jgi:alanyl-tRNA synthetase
MQPLKPKFESPDGSGYGNIQYCVRTNDIDEVGDGTHLTFFNMIGSFGFGTHNYDMHCEMWMHILRDLDIDIDHVDVHPDSPRHRHIWDGFGYHVRFNPECVWSDGNVGGYCSEVFTSNGLEVGNLVNPLGVSVDVGFGYERLLQIMEGKSRVDETELFNQFLDPISRDHYRTMSVFFEQGIQPGNKGRNYVSRRLLRRLIRLNPKGLDSPFVEWFEEEQKRREKSIREGQKFWRRNVRNRPISDSFYWETFGILPEEMDLLKTQY